MFLAFRPSHERILRFLAHERSSPFSYGEHLATLGAMPGGYTIDEYGTVLGEGAACFAQARAALMRFANYPPSWTRVFTDGDRAPAPGSCSSRTSSTSASTR